MTEPAAPEPTAALPEPPPPGRLLRATAIVATLGVVIALLGAGSLLRPVSSPVQDCGTVAGFLLDGRTDQPIDLNNLPKGVTRTEAEAAAHRGCRARVGDAAVPGAIAMAAGVTLALLATALEMGIRLAGRSRRRRAAHPAAT